MRIAAALQRLKLRGQTSAFARARQLEARDEKAAVSLGRRKGAGVYAMLGDRHDGDGVAAVPAVRYSVRRVKSSAAAADDWRSGDANVHEQRQGQGQWQLHDGGSGAVARAHDDHLSSAAAVSPRSGGWGGQGLDRAPRRMMDVRCVCGWGLGL